MSFRISSSLRAALENESKKAGLNLNTFVSQIFTRYVNWWKHVDMLKLLPVSKDLLRELFQALSEETVEKIAGRLGETQGREEVLFFFQQVNPRTVLQYIELWTSHFDATEHAYDGKRHFFTVHHDVNLNFSLFTKEYLTAMIRTTLARPVLFETISPNAITFNFEG